MNTANYLKNGKYPLSTETLSFIQDQIKLLEALAGLGGKNYIIQPNSKVGGIAVITKKVKTGIIERDEREVLELLDSPTYSQQTRFVTVLTEKKNIVADDHTYTEARIYRRAQFSVNRGAESYPINSFINFISHSAITLDQFPTNAILAERIRQVPATVLEYLKDTLAKKLTFSTMKGLTKEQIDGLRTSCVLSCSGSVALFGQTDYTLIVTEQGSKQVRQELIQGTDSHYVRTYNGAVWGTWTQQTETAMHLDVKITSTRVYVRHGALGEDCDLVLLRKKKRSRWRATGGAKAYSKNRGIRKKRTAKTQYVYFKGIKLSKGTPSKWYVPKCIAVDDPAKDGNLIGKELPGLCKSLFYVGKDGYYRIQGSRKRIVLKGIKSGKGKQHAGYAPIGLQIARLNPKGGKDSGGEIVRMKYRISQYVTATKTVNGKPVPVAWNFKRSFSIE